MSDVLQIQVMPDGKVNVMHGENWDTVPGATGEVVDSAEGQIWVEIKGVPINV